MLDGAIQFQRSDRNEIVLDREKRMFIEMSGGASVLARILSLPSKAEYHGIFISMESWKNQAWPQSR